MAAFPSNEEDANLMMAASQAHIPTDKATSKSADSTSNSNTDALARSNLLRLETTELIKEATLHLHPNGNDSSIHYEAKWAPSVRGYVSNLSSVLGALDKCTLSPDVCLISSSSASGGGVKEKGMEQLNGGGGVESTKYRVPLQSDKFLKSLPGGSTTTTATTPWTFPFSGKVKIVPIGSYAHIGNAGLTNRHANGNVVPTLDLAVLVKGGDGDDDAFVSGKDYLNHRYTDKQNILAVHIAKQLSHKKHRSQIGSVHLTRVFGDSRKVALLLTPPTIENDDKKKGKDKKKKRKRSDTDDTDGGKKTKNKLRFHVRLIFGVEQEQQSQDNSNHHQNDDDSMDTEGSYGNFNDTQSFQSWIPISRLFPNRSNNRGAVKLSSTESTDVQHRPTPHYNNALSESLHLESTTNLISDTISNIFFGSNAVATPTTTFHETLLLIKIWALQRGLLRGHDSFTTTTIALILVYLYRTKTIGKRMGSVQAFTTFMKFWSEADWLGEDNATAAATVSSGSTPSISAGQLLARKMKRKSAFVIPADGKNESQTVAQCPQARHYREDIRGSSNDDENVPMTLLDCYKQCFTTASSSSSSIPNDCSSDSPILLDPTMTINYLARLSPSFVRESRAEAYAALRCIHGQERDGGLGSSGSGGAFRKLFLETNRFWTRYDAYVRIPLSVVPKMVSQRGGKKVDRVWGFDVEDLGYDESVCRSVVDVLHRALGDRITAVRLFTSGNGDIRKDGTSSNQSVENVGTKAIEDSDQSYNIPVRGTGSPPSTSSCGFMAEPGGRSPEPPVRPLNHDEPCLVVGLRIDPNASRRVVDRGPPAEDVEGSNAFVALWGDIAQLRRFQDGAIVRAVVWNLASPKNSIAVKTPQFSSMDRSMGGIVEKVVQHIVKLHFTESKLVKKGKAKQVSFELRNMVGLVDGVSSSSKPSPLSDSFSLHKNVMSAFDSLAEFLRQNSVAVIDNSLGTDKKSSKLGLPLKIDEVEPLSPSLRYSSLFPPVPHPLLGGTDLGTDKRKVSGAVEGSPVLIQIRFEGSSKWPSSLSAMGAAKCAMLIQLADGIEKLKQNENLDEFDGPIDVTPTYLDIGYRGYSWRIIVRADQELRMLKSLSNPTHEAKSLRLSLINRHVRGSMHHSLIHAVHTRHPSSSLVSRLAHRWVAAHMLSDMIPQEAIELIVAKIYTESQEGAVSKIQSMGMPPSTVAAGFFRFLQVLSTHDWANEPLIVDPQSHITAHDRGLIMSQFNSIRGPDVNKGPAMYIISPADYDGVEEMTGSKVVGDGSAELVDTTGSLERVWSPTYTSKFPERVVLHRASALAKCSLDHLTSCIVNGSSGSSWVAAFQESAASLTSYSALLRVDSPFVTDTGCCSTNADSFIGASKQDSNSEVTSPFERSLLKRYSGPKDLRKKMYKNLVLEKSTLHEWHPVKSLISRLRSKYGEYAVFFYNEFSPDIIAMIWRPAAFAPKAFSAMMSEYQSPVLKDWRDDSLVITNTDELISEIGYAGRDMLSDIKVLDDKKPPSKNEGKRQKK
eukprot:scaffold1915_cov143-Skeletonema_menzelii.AAC.8